MVCYNMNKEVNDTEEWRPCGGDFGKAGYICSSHGRIARVLAAPKNPKTGYRQIIMCCNGKRKSTSLHRVIAEAFLGTCPVGYVVNHLDEDKTNNRADNLEYCSCFDNVHWSRYRYCKSCQ